MFCRMSRCQLKIHCKLFSCHKFYIFILVKKLNFSKIQYNKMYNKQNPGPFGGSVGIPRKFIRQLCSYGLQLHRHF